MPATQSTAVRRLLRLPEVCTRVGLSRTEIYRRIQRKTFPSPIQIGPQTSAWDSVAIDRWVDAQVSRAAVRERKEAQ